MVLVCIGIVIGFVGYKTQEAIDYTDSFTKELLKNPEPYVGKEVTLTLDKRKYFAIVDFLEPSRKHVDEYGVVYEGGYRFYHETIKPDGSVVSVDLYYLGDPISIKGAKAVKLTGVIKKMKLMQEDRMVYVIEMYKAEPIH